MLSRKSAALLLSAILFMTAVPARAGEDSAKTQEELKRIQKELKGVKNKANEKARQERSVLADIDAIDKSLAEKRAEVKRIEGKLGAVSQEMNQTGSEMERTRTKVGEKQGDLAQRLASMYKTNRAGGAWPLLVSGGYGSVMKRYKYLSVISQRDKALVDRYEGDLDSLAKYKDELKTKRASYDKLMDARDAEARRVQAKEEEKKVLLASVRKQKGSYEAMARELEESSRRLQDLMKHLEDQARAKPKSSLPNNAPAITSGLNWPVNGKVISMFGRQKHPVFDTYIYKKGIEIQASLGAEVRAVESGEVAFANWFKGLGLVAILRHGGDYYTVYAHLADLRVKSGDKITKGQAIATLGDSGAPSGPSLYFEVRKGSEAEDPIKWLKKR